MTTASSLSGWDTVTTSLLLRVLTFNCRQEEALDYDAINCSLTAFVQCSTDAFYTSKTAGDFMVDDTFVPVVVLFTSVPSETYAPSGAFRVYVVGTTSEEIDVFFFCQSVYSS